MTNATIDRKEHSRASQRDAPPLPQISRFLLKGFLRYIPRLLRKNFNAVRLAVGSVSKIPPDQPVICYINHPGWWDPILAFYLNKRFLDGRNIYVPIDNSALKQYPVFRKLGFYGIEMESNEGAKRFLRVTRALLDDPKTAIWMTPGGKFCDPRERTKLQPGLAHVVAAAENITVLPIALEYTFWEERTPEALIQFGEPITGTDVACRTKSDWQAHLEDALATVQTELAEKAIARDYAAFETQIDGSAGAGGLYDGVRKIKSWLGLGSFRARHRQAQHQEMRPKESHKTKLDPQEQAYG